ncbi:thrombospondin type 3 repeat-containing protein [Haloferula sp.]|uniref:thrombospondin type 3 repeat-containing protein n=1 Tax=Haloferula sp. TaxID=2497595 RepID=UPI003C743BA4
MNFSAISVFSGQKCHWLGLLVLLCAQAHAAPTITSFKIIGPNIEIVVENVPAAEELRIQTSGAMNTWPKLIGSTVTNNGGGKFTFTAPKPSATKAFYRAISIQLGAGVDPDGDGLPTALESTEGSDFALFDTDDDGFSDGVEYAYGTDPLDPDSKPVFVDLPTVNFVLAHSTASEGSGPHQMQIEFDRPYSGLVNYAVNDLGNTTVGTDFTLGANATSTSGSISMNGTSAFIPLTVINDDVVSGQRAVIIDIKPNGEEYFLGGRFTHIVIIEDNDAWWTGSLIPASGENDGRTFRLKIADTGAGVTATFGAGAGEDGLPVPDVEAGGGAPAIGATSNSSSIIPDGSWPAVVNAASSSRFSVVSPELPVPPGSLFPNDQIRRVLSLNAQPSLNAPGRPHILGGVRYLGDYTESLASSSGASLASFPGSFILVRDIPSPLPVLSKLVPAAP